MNASHVIRYSVAAVLVWAVAVRPAAAHNSPINVFDDLDDQLFIDPAFDAGPLNLLGGVLLTTDTPGIGALSPGNNVAGGTQLYLTVTRGLLYWDGTDVVPTSAEMWIDAPTMDGFGNPNNSPVASYTVTTTSPPQSGMLWGTYVASPGWDSHGRYTVTPSSAAPGLYGLAFQIESPSYDPTEPFLVPLEYDPSSAFSPANIELGKEFMNDILALPGDANRDGIVNGLDANLIARNFQSGPVGYSLGNVVLDDDVDGLDANLIAINWLATTSATAVPEPSSAALFAAAVSLPWCLRRRRSRASRTFDRS